MTHKFPLALALCGLLSACASDPAPNEQLNLSAQAIEQARAVGADDQVEAFRQALDKAHQAQADMSAKAYKAARLQAEQAELDARLAEAQVLTRKTRAQLAQQALRVERLRKQLQASQ